MPLCWKDLSTPRDRRLLELVLLLKYLSIPEPSRGPRIQEETSESLMTGWLVKGGRDGQEDMRMML